MIADSQDTLSPQASVAILLCSMNGADFLVEQLDSFERQTHRNWKLWVSDDGSSDGTLDILKTYAAKWGGDKLTIVPGPRKGYVANFLSLLCRSEIKADYYALSDQDDMWAPTKIARALRWQVSVRGNVPALYCSRTQSVDEGGHPIGFSPLFSKPPGFRNALVQSIAGGNTMVLNEAARALVCKTGAEVRVPSHDWWIYLVISACGGTVFYDPISEILYRQHGRNLIGSSQGIGAKLRRFTLLLKGQHRGWNEQHIAALMPYSGDITPENRHRFEYFQQSRQASLLGRMRAFCRAKLYRQGLVGNITLWLAVLLRRI